MLFMPVEALNGFNAGLGEDPEGTEASGDEFENNNVDAYRSGKRQNDTAIATMSRKAEKKLTHRRI